MEVKVDIQGLQGVEDALATAGPKLARKALAQSLKKAGEVFMREAKARAPVAVKDTPQRRPGELRDAITAGPVRTSPKHEQASLRVGPEIAPKDKENSSQSPGVYGKFVELGSIHNQKKPYLRPAFDAAGQAALDAATEVLRDAVPELKQK